MLNLGKNKLNVMKLKHINYILVFSFLFFSCDSSEDNEVSEPLLGLYTISKSVLTTDATSANGAATVPSGTDISAAIITAFLSEIECQSAANKAIEIADGNKINFVCRFENKTQDQGSWALNAQRTEFTLTLLIQGTLVPLKITNLVESSSKVVGNVASIPVPPILLASVNQAFAGILDQAVLISIQLELERLN